MSSTKSVPAELEPAQETVRRGHTLEGVGRVERVDILSGKSLRLPNGTHVEVTDAYYRVHLFQDPPRVVDVPMPAAKLLAFLLPIVDD